MSPIVCARHLTKDYGPRRAVKQISFTVARGARFGLLGPNGAGKSTTLRMIACRIPPTSGELSVNGLDARRDAKRIRAQLGFVPQENNLDPDLSVIQNLLAYARYFHLHPHTARERAAKLLHFLALEDYRNARVETLSGGLKRRLVIARALINRPHLLILDEPTAGLDPHVRQQIWNMLDRLCRLEQLTLLISTHYMDEAERLCDQLLIMDQGRIVASGNPRQLVAQRFPPYALEVRHADAIPSPNVRVIRRADTHIYFASTPEELAPIIRFYPPHYTLLRPANLEDLFLELIGPHLDEECAP
jgi:lipooligosaccharide transport system ATP-binding protein